jgi:hypothetical protein
MKHSALPGPWQLNQVSEILSALIASLFSTQPPVRREM